MYSNYRQTYIISWQVARLRGQEVATSKMINVPLPPLISDQTHCRLLPPHCRDAQTSQHLYTDLRMFSCTSSHSLLLSIAGLFTVPFISAILSNVKPAFSWPISRGFSGFCGPPIMNMVRRNIMEPATNSKCASFIQGGSNMTGTDLCANKPHCAAAVRP